MSLARTLQANLVDVVNKENAADLSSSTAGGKSSPREFQKRGLYFQEMVRKNEECTCA
jgi:hypothetical protein